MIFTEETICYIEYNATNRINKEIGTKNSKIICSSQVMKQMTYSKS